MADMQKNSKLIRKPSLMKDKLLDEMELQRRLAISEKQDKMGLGMTVEELRKKTTRKLKNGYYSCR